MLLINYGVLLILFENHPLLQEIGFPGVCRLVKIGGLSKFLYAASVYNYFPVLPFSAYCSPLSTFILVFPGAQMFDTAVVYKFLVTREIREQNTVNLERNTKILNKLYKCFTLMCEIWKLKIWARQVSGPHSWLAKNAQLCHRIRKQQHPWPAHSSEGSRNLPKLWSPWLGHGAVLAASKPLQVSK